MDSGNVAGMWAELQKSSKMPRSLSTCESEVKELMRAIDSMVYQKKKEWEREKRELEAKLSVRNQELRITQSTLEQRHQEVGQLKSLLEVSERSSKDTAGTYEEQLTTLRDEVMTMKRDYERMHRQYCKQVKELKKGKERDAAELEDLRAQTQRDRTKLEDHKARARELEQDRRNAQRQIDTLQAQVGALNHKLDLAVHQSQTYQSELTRHRDLLDSTESMLQRQVEELRQQLDAARDTNNSQETQILRLKSATDTAMSSQKKLLADKVELEATVTRLQQRIKRLEDDLSKIRGDGEDRERAVRASEETVGSLTQQLAQAKLAIREHAANKEFADKQAGDAAHEESKHLRDELAVAATELKKRKKKEDKLQGQVTELQAELAVSQQQYNNLVNNMSSKVGDLVKQKSSEVEVMNAQLLKLKEDLLLAESQRAAEAEEMQATIDRLTGELTEQRGTALAAENKMAAIVDQLNRRAAEMQVVSVQLESMRVENRHLRRLHASAQQHHAELSQLHELEKSFQSSLNHVEDHNDQLEQEVQHLRRQLVDAEEQAQDREESLRVDAERQMQRVRDEEARKVKDAEERGRKLARDVEDRLSSTISDYEVHVDTLRGQLHRMENELQSHDHSMMVLGMENDAMTQFVDGIDQIVKSTPMNSAERNRPTDASPSPHAMGDASEASALNRRLDTLHQQERRNVEKTIDACIDEFDVAAVNADAEFD